MFEVVPLSLKGRVIHDFTYQLPNRKCPHMGLVNLTPPGQCTHLCAYCYARGYKWSAHPEETGKVTYYDNISEKLEDELSKITLCPPLYLCATTDVFQPVREIIQSTMKAVKTIMRFGASFHIITKSMQVRRLLEISGLVEYPYFFLQMSVETINDEKRRILSPNSSPISERIETLRIFAEKGFFTVMRIDPIIFGYTDDYNEVTQLLRIAKGIGVKHIITSTTRFDPSGMQAVKDRLLKEGMDGSYQQIKESYTSENGWLRVPREKRENFHRRLKVQTERLGMTYAVCMELDRSFDSSSILHCEGSPNSFMMMRTKDGEFKPICNADCIRSCPNQRKPPCGTPQLASHYPYDMKTLYAARRSPTQVTFDQA
jgi:DNA repair photolyase